MVNIRVFLAVSIVLYATSAFSGEYDTDSDVKFSPGTEVVKESSMEILVPKGGKPRIEPGRIYLESTDEYAARRFDEMEERFVRIEAEQNKMKDGIEKIEKALTRMRREEQVSREAPPE